MTKPHCSNPRARAEIRQRTAAVDRAERQEARRIRPTVAAITELGSEGERALETHLRQRGFPAWTRELQFDVARRWRFDFAWPEYLVAIEVEGATYALGRHSRGKGFEADCVKYAEAAIAGWLVLRVTTDMVLDGRAITLAGRALWSASQRQAGR